MNTLSNQVLTIVIQAIIAVLGVVISTIGVIAIKYVQAKRDEIITKIGKAQYEQDKSYAVDAWNFVEEHFRISGLVMPTITEKIALFEKELLNKVPGLTQTELDSLRLSLGGEINKGKVALTSPIESSQTIAQ